MYIYLSLIYILCTHIYACYSVYTHVYAVAIQVLSFAYKFRCVNWYLRVMASARYCFGCRRKCRHSHWYGTPEFPFCGASYTKMFRRGFRVRHPSWPVYEESAYESDETGARICAAVFRKDALAIREGAVLLSRSMLEPVMRILVSLLASTFYFPWPSHAFILRIVELGCKAPGKATLSRIGLEVYEQFKAFRVVDGQLVAASPAKGISVTKNPSERQCGRIRFNAIIDDFPAVLRMLTRMQDYFKANARVSLAAMLKVFGDSGVYTSRVFYKNVRCVRILAEAAGKPLRDCEEDFAVFQRMSAHMRTALKYRGIDDYKTAMKFVVGMRAETGLTQYSLNDLIIYTCLLDRVVFDD